MVLEGKSIVSLVEMVKSVEDINILSKCHNPLDYILYLNLNWQWWRKSQGSPQGLEIFTSTFGSEVLRYYNSLLSFWEIFPFPAVPDILNQYIFSDETNSSSINDSKRDVAPKWVDLSSVPWCIVLKPLRGSSLGWMKAKKKRMLKIFIATDIYFFTPSACKSSLEKQFGETVNNRWWKWKMLRAWLMWFSRLTSTYSTGPYMTNYLSSNKDHKSPFSCSSSCNSTWKDSLLHYIKHCTCSGHLH